MTKRILAAMIAVACFATTVGIGVHILHKDARADTAYTVYITEDDEPVEGLTVWIQWRDDGGGGWEETETDENAPGFYKATTDLTEAQVYDWVIWIIEAEDLTFNNPSVHPTSVLLPTKHLDWDVEDNRP